VKVLLTRRRRNRRVWSWHRALGVGRWAAGVGFPPSSFRLHPSGRRYLIAAFPLLAASWLLAVPRPAEVASALKPVRAAVLASRETLAEEPDPLSSRVARLEMKLRALCSKAPARRSAVYVQEIDSGLTAGVNPNRAFVAASLIKLPVMAAAYRLWEEEPERKTPLARTWLEWMITVSDNASTDRLIDLVGGPEVVTELCEDRGWPNLRVRHAIQNHRGRRGRNVCTAREVAEFLVALEERRLVSEEADEEMWQVLRRQKKLRRIPAGIPKLPGVEVGSKTGTLGSVLHDAAIVRTPRTRYALCILLAGQRSDAAGERFCRTVSRSVFDALHGEQ